MSMLLMTLDVNTGRLYLAGCGHERPLIYRAAERRIEKMDLGGLVLGVVPDLAPYVEEQQLDLAPGDAVLFYTDGVTEAVDPQRRPFGIEQTEELLLRHGAEPTSSIVARYLEALDLHAGGATQHDDITLIAIRRR